MTKTKIFGFLGLVAVFFAVCCFLCIPQGLQSDSKANAETKTFTITFNADDYDDINKITLFEGGVAVEKTSLDPIQYTYTDGESPQKVWLYQIYKSGYELEGWYLNTLEGVKYDREAGFFYIDSSIKRDLTLYANMTPIQYNIIYVNIDGATNQNPNTYTTDEGLTFKKPEKTGYTFLGWYTDPDFTNQIEGISKGTLEDITVYAKFEIKDCVLSYAYGGYDDIELKYGDTITADMLPTPQRDGYVFEGWFTTMGYVFEIKTDDTIKGNLTLYPKWTKLENPVWKPLTFGGMGLALVLACVWLIVFKRSQKNVS